MCGEGRMVVGFVVRGKNCCFSCCEEINYCHCMWIGGKNNGCFMCGGHKGDEVVSTQSINQSV